MTTWCLNKLKLCTFYKTFISNIFFIYFQGRKQKVRKDDQIRVPRSLFDRPTAALQKMRREAKLQRLKQGLKPTIKSLPSLSSSKPMLETGGDHPEWLIHEDWALLQVTQLKLTSGFVNRLATRLEIRERSGGGYEKYKEKLRK